ncbi:MAG: hypothetical protein NC113_10710 [Bacteroides sp.]|nr:hypothetical protein [Bacteroides sp.]MCM1448663.1 hypothetical protein [Bacteroides sp.]
MRLLTVISCALLLLCSCSGDNKIKEEMERFYGQHVVLPLDSMLYVADDSIGYAHDVMADRYRLVVYYDSTECSSCRLKTLYEWDSLIDSVSSSGHKVDFHFVFHVPKQRVEEVKAALTTYAHNLPVYLDTTGVFERTNPCLPSLSVMRTFMLDSKDSVVLVGNPVHNSRVADMMWNIIQGNKH